LIISTVQMSTQVTWLLISFSLLSFFLKRLIVLIGLRRWSKLMFIPVFLFFKMFVSSIFSWTWLLKSWSWLLLIFVFTLASFLKPKLSQLVLIYLVSFIKTCFICFRSLDKIIIFSSQLQSILQFCIFDKNDEY